MKKITLLLLLVLSTMLVGADLQMTADDVFTELKTNDAKLATAIFSLDNPSSVDLTEESLSFSFNEVCGEVTNYRVFILDTCTRKEPVYSYIEVCENISTNETNMSNTTTEYCHMQEEISGYEAVDYSCYKEVEIIPSGSNDYKIEADISWERCADGRIGYRVDWIPKLAVGDQEFEQISWAWWNTSYGHKRAINCSNVDDGTPIVINGSDGFSINSTNQIVWTECQNGTGLAVYFNDYSDYVVANDSGIVAFEVELGNTSDYNPSTLWTDYAGVWHMTDLHDSTSNENNITNYGADATGAANCYVGGCYDFIVANTDYMTIADDNSLDLTDPYTMVIMRPEDMSNTEVYCKKNRPATDMYVNYCARLNSGGSGNIDIYYPYGIGGTTGVFGANTWAMMHAFADDSTTNRVIMHINDTLTDNASYTNAAVQGSSYLAIGVHHNSGGNPELYFEGYIDEFRVAEAGYVSTDIDNIWENLQNTAGYGNLGDEETPDYANETEGRTAIETGITNAIATATIYTDQQIYVRYLNGSQKLGSFDKVASYGDQRWAFNYVTTGESYVNMVNMTPTLYVLEMQDKSIDDITTEVQAFINDTLS